MTTRVEVYFKMHGCLEMFFYPALYILTKLSILTLRFKVFFTKERCTIALGLS